MYRVEPLSHTADVGYRVVADSLADLYRGAADGLVRSLRAEDGEDRGRSGRLPRVPEAGAGGEGVGPDGERRVERLSLRRPDRERLMVSWLRELLHRITTRGRFPAAVSVETAGAPALEAVVEWEAEPDPEGLAREIKGVTYHGLEVERTAGGEWHARLVLDV